MVKTFRVHGVLEDFVGVRRGRGDDEPKIFVEAMKFIVKDSTESLWESGQEMIIPCEKNFEHLDKALRIGQLRGAKGKMKVDITFTL